MKDRLIELIRKKEDEFISTCPRYSKGATLKICNGCKYDMEDGSCDYAAREADYLLENGVIVPPCKVGQIVFAIDYEEYPIIREAEIIEITKNKHGTFIRYEYPAFRGREYVRRFEHIGKIVFLTREEAKANLKGGA